MAASQLQLSTRIQASFGKPDDPDYIFDIAANGDKSIMAVSLSTDVIKLYNPVTGAYMSDLKGHTSTISAISFPDVNSPNLLFSSSTDATIRTWDIRLGKQVAVFKSPGAGDELWSFSVGGNPASLIAGGGNAQVLIWDWRSKKLAATWDELHREAVTKVQFHPERKERLVTASVDGLINIIDTKKPLDSEEDVLESIFNLETSLSKFGFYGKNTEMIWVLTHIETLSIWKLEEQTEAVTFNDARAKASFGWNLPSVKYLIDCHSIPGSDSLWLTAGNDDGSLGYFPVSYTKAGNPSSSVGVIGDVAAVLEGGHEGVVRAVWLNQDTSSQQPLFCWTGGEDGRLCSWSQNGSTDRGQAWVSSNLVMRKSASKFRHNPY